MTFSRDLQQGISPYKAQALECARVLLQFLKNPVLGMRQLPTWDWPTLILFHTALAATFGFLGGLISLRFGRVFSGLIIYPISTLFIVAIISGFFYYTFLFIYHRELDFKKLVTLVVFAHLPNTFLSIFAYHLPPIILMGVAASGMLLIVGLTELSQIDRKKIIQLVGGIVTLYVAFW
ncbi:MAG: YIP1 family protein, partial [Bdellovibrionota bacterium]